VAVCMRPLEGDRGLTDPYFYPIYEEACRLNMAIAVHIANGNPANCELWRFLPGTRQLNGFALFRAPTVLACFLVLMSELPQVFPTLRWGFIEASAQWVPWIYNEVKIPAASCGAFRNGHQTNSTARSEGFSGTGYTGE
jgi:hypothetical protein